MRVPLRHRPTREDADNPRNLGNRAVRRALSVNGEDGNRHNANHARDERPVASERRPHGADSGAGAGASVGAALGAALGASTTRGASHATVMRWGPTWTTTDTPTSGRPCASGSGSSRAPTGVEHTHGRCALEELDDGTDEGPGTGGRWAPEHAPRISAEKERRDVITPSRSRSRRR